MSGENVSGAVSAIVAAFANGLDVFKKLRERRRRRKSERAAQAGSGDELSLSNSLRRGPRDVQREYERRYSRAGSDFARGDATALTFLNQTLLKLNTGLVAIIACFLSSGDKGDRHLDYKSLTSLSDASRASAIDALAQLDQRLSQARLAVHQMQYSCTRCGGLNHQDCGYSTNNRVQNGEKCPFERRRRASGASPAEAGPTVARISKANGSQGKLVIMRPRNRRATSSSSSSVNGVAKLQSSPALTSVLATVATSLPPDSVPPKPPAHPSPGRKPVDPTGQKKSRPRKPLAAQRPEIGPYDDREPTLPVLKPHPPLQAIPRRADKPTPSDYSFASDSTKLGEIPMRKWGEPYDYAAMEKLNAEAAMRGWVPVPAEDGKQKKKSGLLKFWRKT